MAGVDTEVWYWCEWRRTYCRCQTGYLTGRAWNNIRCIPHNFPVSSPLPVPVGRNSHYQHRPYLKNGKYVHINQINTHIIYISQHVSCWFRSFNIIVNNKETEKGHLYNIIWYIIIKFLELKWIFLVRFLWIAIFSSHRFYRMN